MDNFTETDLKILISEQVAPCVSLYAPLETRDAQQDPIRWKNSLAEAERRLISAGTSESDLSRMLRPAVQLLDNAKFWQSGGAGLICFLAPHFFRSYRLDWPVREHVSVGRVFDIRQLLPMVADSGRFYVLAISQNAVRLIRATGYDAKRIELGGPANMSEALRAHDTDEPLTYHTFAKGAGPTEAAFHGHRVGIDDAKDDLLRYCRAIDRALHIVLKDEHSPLVLATVDYVMPIFRQASKYRNVLEHGIPGNPEHLSDRTLIERAWPLVKPIIQRDSENAVSLYRQLAGSGRTSNDFKEVVSAACHGRVQMLFIAEGHDAWGRFDPKSDCLDVHASIEPGDDELTNLAAVQALRHGRAVHSLPADRMPDNAPIALIYLLPLAKHKPRPRHRKVTMPSD